MARTENPVKSPKFPPTELIKSKTVYRRISSVRSISVLRKDMAVEKVFFVLLGDVMLIICLNLSFIFAATMLLESYSVASVL